MSSEVCCICTSPTRSPIKLQCQHSYCQFCHRHLALLSEHLGSINCPICLKSNRQPCKQQHQRLHSPFPSFSSPVNYQKQGDRSRDKLYCFTCQVTFHTNDYINGNHRSHRVKTQQQATAQLQQQHLRSLRILECKMEDYIKKEVSLEKHLNQTFKKHKETQEQLGNYFDNLIIEIQKQRNSKLVELEEIYNRNTQILLESIKELKTNLKQTGDCGRAIKEFCNGNLTINQFLRSVKNLKEELQLKPHKITLPTLPKLIQTYDISFHIKNCLSFIGQGQSNIKEQSMMETKSSVQTDIQSAPGVPRRVRLIEKVRNQLNTSCRFVRDDYFLFQL